MTECRDYLITGKFTIQTIIVMARKYRHFVFDESQRFIYPTSDWGFKYLLGTEQHKDLLLGILQELLPDLGIRSLEYLPQEIGIPIGKMKRASFDVFCKLSDGGQVVIEMQNYAYQAFLDRAVVYTSAAILGNYVNSAAKEYQIGKTIFIAFVGDPLFKDTDRTPIRLSLCDMDEPLTTLRCDRVLQIFVELSKFEGSIQDIDENTPFVEQLAHVLMEMVDCKEVPCNLTNPLLKRLFTAADKSNLDDKMIENYRSSILNEADYEYLMAGATEEGRVRGLAQGREEGLAAGREEGLAAGREEGLAAGREEGMAAGRKEGLSEGRHEQALSDAARFKAAGVPLEVIASCTGLTAADLEAL